MRRRRDHGINPGSNGISLDNNFIPVQRIGVCRAQYCAVDSRLPRPLAFLRPLNVAEASRPFVGIFQLELDVVNVLFELL